MSAARSEELWRLCVTSREWRAHHCVLPVTPPAGPNTPQMPPDAVFTEAGLSSRPVVPRDLPGANTRLPRDNKGRLQDPKSINPAQESDPGWRQRVGPGVGGCQGEGGREGGFCNGY